MHRSGGATNNFGGQGKSKIWNKVPLVGFFRKWGQTLKIFKKRYFKAWQVSPFSALLKTPWGQVQVYCKNLNFTIKWDVVQVFVLVIAFFTSKKNGHKFQKESSRGIRENNYSETQPKDCGWANILQKLQAFCSLNNREFHKLSGIAILILEIFKEFSF